MDEVIKERLEFLKLEYQQLISQLQHRADIRWRIRQLSLTLWLVALGAGLGVITEGLKVDFNILIISTIIPAVFLLLDAYVYKLRNRQKARLLQIELFLSEREYNLPSTRQKITFKQFCGDRKKTHDFPVLDFYGLKTFGNDKSYELETGSTLYHMKSGIAVLFYHFQLVTSLTILALQLNKLHNNPVAFSITGISPLLHFSLVIFSKIREARIRRRAE
jgi:hypothetical protein